MMRMVGQLIIEVFNRHCGKWQEKKPEPERQAMLVEFNKKLEPGEDDGYRYYDLLIYGSANYVQVWVRERWVVAKWETAKDGDPYVEGSSPWQLVVDHDSGWREGVNSFLSKNAQEISSIRDGWKFVPASEVPPKTESSRVGPIKV